MTSMGRTSGTTTFCGRSLPEFRQALKTHYFVARTIPGIEGLTQPWFKTISVLEPRVIDESSGVGDARR